MEIIPKNRDKTAKFAYIFLRRFYRIHRKEVEKAVFNSILYGAGKFKVHLVDDKLKIDLLP